MRGLFILRELIRDGFSLLLRGQPMEAAARVAAVGVRGAVAAAAGSMGLLAAAVASAVQLAAAAVRCGVERADERGGAAAAEAAAATRAVQSCEWEGKSSDVNLVD